MKSTTTKSQPTRNPTTGLNLSLRITLGEIEPPRIKLPWATKDANVTLSPDLSPRILNDIEELVARAVHLSVDRWMSQSSPELEAEMSAEIAEADRRMRQFIQEGIKSRNSKRRKAAESWHSQLVTMERAEAQRAALELARIGNAVASWLEYLADERLDLLIPVARQFAVWPFNLGMSKEKRGGRRDLLRAKLAKKYLSRLQLSTERYQPGETSPQSEGKALSPFRAAAEQIYEVLRTIRAQPLDYLPHPKLAADSAEVSDPRLIPLGPVSQWVTDLFGLKEPMNKDNWPNWWKVARLFLSEQWDQNQKAFRLLIAASKREELLKPPTNKPSLVKSYIIDQVLKREFETLAIRAAPVCAGGSHPPPATNQPVKK